MVGFELRVDVLRVIGIYEGMQTVAIGGVVILEMNAYPIRTDSEGALFGEFEKLIFEDMFSVLVIDPDCLDVRALPIKRDIGMHLS